ncbi:hypothetical protein PTSG_03433 [Salpingoeca rosetta]|uniref:C3HC-type domain-containing protein n=1 Tax=Salpingoeca rosetta (strain ATCC 50818 / BSB-021) TaxID=946362 RepID=F2U567_SALR5|nr:uncharacterized protein PTSG_03433 [Salpingoeca rosetta]EGD82783.1 hypothetical protein PTSG_03433 [Salpingoeca rosetta]|eukprot:XP_004996019.1 hypothetical protein PTSG_03433 [Salpingoeca rosetta]
MDPHNTRVRITSLLSSIADSAKEHAESKDDDKATCRPHNKDDFAARVDTFKVTTWFNKPSELSSLQCARFGWTNSKEDTLTCVTCRSILNCRIDNSLSATSVQSLVAKFADNLKTGHKTWCPWRTNYCRVEMAHPPVEDKPTEQHLINDRLRSLVRLHNLPPTRIHQSVFNDLKRLHTALNLGDAFAPVDGAAAMKVAHLLLALTGWSSDQQPNRMVRTLKCGLCQRACAVWNFDHVVDGGVFPTNCHGDGGGGGGGGGGGDGDASGDGDDAAVEAVAATSTATTTTADGSGGGALVVYEGGFEDDTAAAQGRVTAAAKQFANRWAVPAVTPHHAATVPASTEKQQKCEKQQEREKQQEHQQLQGESGLRYGRKAMQTSSSILEARRRAAMGLDTAGPRFGAATSSVGQFLFGLNFKFNPNAAHVAKAETAKRSQADARTAANSSSSTTTSMEGDAVEPAAKKAKQPHLSQQQQQVRQRSVGGKALHWGDFNPVTSHRPCCVWANPERAAQVLSVLLNSDKNASTTTSRMGSATTTPLKQPHASFAQSPAATPSPAQQAATTPREHQPQQDRQQRQQQAEEGEHTRDESADEDHHHHQQQQQQQQTRLEKAKAAVEATQQRRKPATMTADAWIWIIAVIVIVFLLFLMVFNLLAFDELRNDHKNPVDVSASINPWVLPEYAAHTALTVVFLFTGKWVCFGMNAILVAYHAHRCV